MARPVHYASHGSGGLAFRCYFKELQQHIDSADTTAPKHDQWQTRSVPAPRRHTDLRKVTCPDCWHQIAAMAAKAKAE